MIPSSIDRAVGSFSIEDLPILGTLVLVFAMERISKRHEHQSLLEAISGSTRHSKGLSNIYYVVVVCSLFATLIPILNKTYFRLKPEKQSTSKMVLRMAKLAKNLLWFACALCLFALSIETENPFMAITTAIVFFTSLLLIVTYRQHYAEFERKARM